ncbi:hypothetical protein M8C21_018682 [Ambrosia artemisiifolia]|uniref:Uncharacterized protein n=1 Tax=Ambrosia artemisiifolia TaxID=4212 RepID=A0AAD5GZL1_AMBAR|nr:hypothetical protein M8C21_018682 [Ambrosia artemisiifolia]
MEWYFGSEAEDLVVPEAYEQQAQMISSPETWSHWDMTGFESSYPKKNFESNMNMTHDGLYNDSESLLWNDEADFQQFAKEEARINHMDDDDDDIFFSSLLEEDPTEDSSSTRLHDNTILGNNADIIKGKMVNSQYVGRYGQSNGSSRYQMPQYTSNESSMEASVLNDLERVTAQFTNKTRLCFRDAFYRLAESSKESLNSCQAEESMMTSNDDTLRAGETEDTESKTNVIDRAVANLIFHKYEFDDTCSQQQTDYNNDVEVPITDVQDSGVTTTNCFLNY